MLFFAVDMKTITLLNRQRKRILHDKLHAPTPLTEITHYLHLGASHCIYETKK